MVVEAAATDVALADNQEGVDIPETVVSETAVTKAALTEVTLEASSVVHGVEYMAADPAAYTPVDSAEARGALARVVDLCLVRSAA